VVHLAYYPGFCEGGWNDQHEADRYPGIVEREARPVAIEVIGEGCGAAGPWPCLSYGPADLAHESGWPAVGASATFRVDMRQANGSPMIGLMVLGLDATAWAGQPLPLPLAPLGWPAACLLHVAPLDLAAVTLDGYGRGQWTAAFPSSPTLAGSTLYLQALAVAAGSDRCSEATNGIRLVVQR
jgi:hypothetical protein